MAEILKAGDGEATAEEEPEDMFAEEYEPASMKDEAKMLENMDFAIQELGEIATKVQVLVNFVNPYCGTEVNESGDQPKFKVGDVVKVQGVSGMDFHGRDAPIGPIVKIEPPHPDVGVYEYLINGRSGEFFAYEDELELVSERFTEENDIMDKPARYGIGDHVLYKGEECVVTDIDEDLRNDEEIYQVSRDSDKVDGLSFNDWVTWDDLEPLEGFTENIGKFNFRVGDKVKVVGRDLASKGWIGVVSSVDKSSPGLPYTVYFVGRESGEYAPEELAPAKGFTEEEKNTMKFKKIDERIGGGSDDEWLSEKDIIGMKVSGESSLENELNKGDDGWTTIGQPVSEAKVVVDANDVWDVLELLDNDIAHKELTDLINSHVRTEEEIMDAIDELCGETISKKELNTLLSGRMATLVDYLGLDVEQYESNGEFVEEGKPTSVELESDDMRSGWEKLDAVEFCDWMMDYSGTFTAASGIRIENATPRGDDEIAVDLSYAKKNADIGKFVDSLLRKVANWRFDGKIEPKRDEDGSWHCEIKLNKSSKDSFMKLEKTDEQKPEEVKSQDKTFNQDGETKTLVTGEEKKEMSDAEAATIMGGASATDMDAADMGISSHKVADPYKKKPVCEMTIEQDITHATDLLPLLWGPGKKNLEAILASQGSDDEEGDVFIVDTLEKMGFSKLSDMPMNGRNDLGKLNPENDGRLK